MNPSVTITPLSGNEATDHVAALGALLHACVHDGASVGFVLPFTLAEGEAYWRNRGAAARAGWLCDPAGGAHA
jgi:hypothetical protein